MWVKSITAVLTEDQIPDETSKGGADTWQSQSTQYIYDQIDLDTGKYIPIDLSSYTFMPETGFPSFNNPYNPAADSAGNVNPSGGGVEYVYPSGLQINENGVPAQLQVRFSSNEEDAFEVEFVYNHPTNGSWIPAKPIAPAVADPSNPPIWYPQEITFIYKESLVDGNKYQQSRGSNDTEYYQSRITLPTKTSWKESEKVYLTYSPEFDNNIPAVDSVFAFTDKGQYFNEGSFFPILPFIQNGKNIAVERGNNEQYDSCTELGRFIGLDYYDMGQQISNPDVGGGDNNDFDPSIIAQAAMVMAVPLGSRNNDDMLYLFGYFFDLYSKVPNSAKSGEYNFYEDDYNYYPADGGDMANIDESIGIVISDSDYRTIFSFDNITIVIQQGVLIPHEDDDEADWEILTAQESINRDIKGIVGTCQNDLYDRSSPDTWHTDPPSTSKDRILRKQITPDVFIQIRITNPAQRYDVYQGYSVISSGDDPKLLIMLDYNIARSFTPFVRERLYARSLQIVFTTHQVEKTKWYQQKWFQVVLVVVAVVLILSNVPGGWMVISAALAGSTAAIIIVMSTLLIGILGGLVVGYAAEKLVEKIGIEGALVLAVMVTAMAIYTGQTGNFESFFAMTADNAVMAVTNLSAAVQQEILEETLEIQSKYEELFALQEEYDAENEAIAKILDFNTNLASAEDYIGLQPLFVPGESPDHFLIRSCHVGNPGAQTLEIIENYVSTSLKLPTLNESYGEF